MGQALAQAFGQVLDPTVLTVIALAAMYGTLFGSIPGLSATAWRQWRCLIVPLTYFLSPLAALAAVITLEACAISAGDIPSALVRIPGTPASAAYADDLYHLAQRGQVRTCAWCVHHLQCDRWVIRGGRADPVRAAVCGSGDVVYRRGVLLAVRSWGSDARSSCRGARRSKARSRCCSGCCCRPSA